MLEQSYPDSLDSFFMMRELKDLVLGIGRWRSVEIVLFRWVEILLLFWSALQGGKKEEYVAGHLR